MLGHILHKKHFLSVFLILLAIAVFAASFQVQEFVEQSFLTVKNLIETNEITGLLVFIALGALSSMLSPFSVVPFIPIAVLAWGDMPTIFIVLFGWVLGGVISFSLTRFLGRPFVRKFISFEHIDHYLKQLPEKLEFELLLVFRLALPSEIPGYVVGLTSFPFRRYLLATILSEIPFAVISVYASEAFLKKQYIPLIMWIIVATLIIGIMFNVLRKLLKYYREVKKMDLPLPNQPGLS